MKKSQSRWRLATFLADIGSLVAAYLFAYFLRFESEITFFHGEDLSTYAPISDYTKQLIVLIPMYFIIYSVLKLIMINRNKRILSEMAFVILSNVLGIALFLMYLFLFKEFGISRLFLLMFLIINILLNIGIHMILDLVRKTATVQS